MGRLQQTCFRLSATHRGEGEANDALPAIEADPPTLLAAPMISISDLYAVCSAVRVSVPTVQRTHSSHSRVNVTRSISHVLLTY
ncbi:MAG: hypothetical protein IIB61_03930 [Planctomycetes bacterium]|nr:hypothetical protein [Planctomycetota bacterium]